MPWIVHAQFIEQDSKWPMHELFYISQRDLRGDLVDSLGRTNYAFSVCIRLFDLVSNASEIILPDKIYGKGLGS